MDTSVLTFLAAPFVASLILAGIHAYLGVHVVERGVIFVDLSLAQIAALGATIALLLPITGGDPHAPIVYWISLAFTFLGAFIFSTIRSKRARIPQEAIIGISYAVASGAAILAMSKATSESEHLKDMLVGNILAVSWADVGKTALLYSVIGFFHYVFRHKFLAISMNPKKAEADGISIKLWDFLFYASFGFVVTSSVSIAGVLLVFCYLIVPSVAAMLYADSIGKRLAIGWTMGTVVSALGVYLSLKLDLPTGATIVCTFGLVLAIMAAVRPLIQRGPARAVYELRHDDRRQGAHLLQVRHADDRSEVSTGAAPDEAIGSESVRDRPRDPAPADRAALLFPRDRLTACDNRCDARTDCPRALDRVGVPVVERGVRSCDCRGRPAIHRRLLPRGGVQSFRKHGRLDAARRQPCARDGDVRIGAGARPRSGAGPQGPDRRGRRSVTPCA